MGLKNIIQKAILIIIFSSFPINAIASWSGPNEVIQGTWGTSDVQFGFQAGEIKDQFPENLQILSDGKIIVEDWVNNRLKIYQPNGTYLKSIEQLGLGLYALDSDKIISFSWDDTVKNERIGVFSLSQAKWLWIDKNRVYDSARATVIVTNDNIFVWDGKQYGYQYSPTGQLIRTSTTRPLELGRVSERPISESQYRITIKYPDKTYELTTGGSFMRYMRDTKGYVYGVNDDSLWKFDQCGKQVGELFMPENQTETVTSKTGKSLAIPVQYGQPVIAPNGDVYTWKKSMLKYSIVKWTWKDDPNAPTGPDAPTGLSVAASINGLYLTWTASPQDPGCVTGYEIARSTSAGGIYSTVATVAKNVVKYNDTSAAAGTTYYYKVRAKAGSDPSAYTAEVSGKR